MDERHWWIAGKIQESFKIGGYDNPTLLEDFMCEETTLGKINKFLKGGGPCRLFFYCDKPESGVLSTRELHVTGNLASLKDVDLDRVTILHFLKHRPDKDVDPQRMERDIYCGELKHNAIETLNTLLSDIYIPLVKAQKGWGQCTEEMQSGLMHSMDKFVTALNETAASMHTSKQLVLKQPENVILNDFKQQRAAALDPQLISQYEELVQDWINTIETILTDTADERFLDPNAGPLSELERWRRRQRLLATLTEQLKGKECKAVIGVLITAKSRLLKRWKIIDASITDAMNDTKDKVKYLESLRRHFDQLYNDATPHNIINNAIPGLTNSIKQMDSISRYYARVGFLGLVLAKVTNQMVLACKEHIQNCTVDVIGDMDKLWECVSEEMRRDCLPSPDPQQKFLRSQIENKVKSGVPNMRNKGKEVKQIGLQDEGLYGRLRACLTVQGFYRESLRSLKDALGATQNLSHYSSVSSFVPPSTVGTKGKQGTSVSGQSRYGPYSPTKKGASIASDVGHGVLLADEDAIMSHMDIFCSRIRQLLDVINTLSQYTKMIQSTAGIPRPRKEDLAIEEPQEDEYQKYRRRKSPTPSEQGDFEDDELASPQEASDPALQAIVEDEDPNTAAEKGEDDGNEKRKEDAMKSADDVFDGLNESRHGLTQQELDILRQYYPEGQEDDGPNVSTVVEQHVERMRLSMSSAVTTKTMLDVESKDKDKFDDYYSRFQEIVHELERFLCAYLQALFVHKFPTEQAVDIVTRFQPVINRGGLKADLNEMFVEIFHWYESDLEEVQQIYEKFKNNPVTVRNAPPVAGAISWSRQLLKRIEDPMKVFRETKAITNLPDFSRVVRMYNRLATALVTFESLWFAQWKNRIEQAKAGLGSTLFVVNPETKEIEVNADERVLELIHESKWLTRIGVQIPESAMAVMEQEGRFKSYKNHLELVLDEYRQVCRSVPQPLLQLFLPHMDHVQQQLQPGLSTLAWNSMNIDAFLHQIHCSTSKLKKLQEQVTDILDTKVIGVINQISTFCLFDYEIAFSRVWPADEFRTSILESIRECSDCLQHQVETVLEGLQAITNLLSLKKPEQSKVLKDKKMVIMVDDAEVEREKQRAAQEEAAVIELIGHYRQLVYAAVRDATCRSLATLAEAAGCTGEVVAAYTPTPRSHPPAPSSAAGSEGQGAPKLMAPGSEPSSGTASPSPRAISQASNLSSATWTMENFQENTHLQFEVFVKFSIPTIIVEPQLETIQNAITDVGNAILEATTKIKWSAMEKEGSFYSQITDDENILDLESKLSTAIDECEMAVNQHLFHFCDYNFLWKDDMHGSFFEFVSGEPSVQGIKREVERYLYIEKKVLGIPNTLPVGPVCLFTDPIKDALHGFAMAWKTKFASVLHEEAKRKLDTAVNYRVNVKTRLENHVQTLDQLNSALHLLEELRDMENKIDSIYLPIETMYSKLREFELRLPRNEVEEVDMLRDKWQELTELADQVREVLLKERRGAFEQELDKQVKTFVVEVIQFRNAFDAQGPAVPGIPPAEAVSRLQDFQHRYTLYDTKRKTLDSVSKLFGIACKPFPELDRTGEELDLLSQLYGLFQKFIRFDNKFRDTLWSEVDLDASSQEVETYWDECLALPSKLKDWDAYHDLKTQLQTYLQVFPLLHNLASKEIRNRHWLQVMQTTGSSFQLEANVFKLCHLLDIGLISHKEAIEEICRGASRELELEIKMRMTEEEWTEQVLNFEPYKRRGPMYLDKVFTERLLEQLEDAQALLASMLTSRYIGPLRDEAASWAEKLKEVAEVLELWLEVQDLWQYLEAVFSNSAAVRDLPQEAKRFARIDKGWTKMMKRAFDTRNVLQCCYGGEVPKLVVLRHLHEELEICFKSLMGYLDNKRHAFPRFYFVSDPILLSMISKPYDLDSVKPHLKAVFMEIADVKLERGMDDSGRLYESGRRGSASRTPVPGMSPLDRARSSAAMSQRTGTPTKIDKRLTNVYSTHMASSQTIPTMLPSEGLADDVVIMDAVSVLSSEGEVLRLSEKVTLNGGVEVWLGKMLDSVGKTLSEMNVQVIEDCNNNVFPDEWPLKYPSQVCRLGLLYHWTKECELGIADVKYDRKALQGTLKKYVMTASKLSSVLVRVSWRSSDEPMLPVHKVRLEAMITQSLFLRDVLENMYSRKLREVTDFEWRRTIRCYMHPLEEKQVPLLWILDSSYQLGNEFYGCNAGIALTPITERCFLTMSQALGQQQGISIAGPTGVGKTETVKGLANILGQFLGLFQCTPGFDPQGVAKICQGMAMDGCWGCFDEVQNLHRDAMSVLLGHMHAILTAIRSKQQFATMLDGQEVSVKRSVSTFLTLNPSVALPSFEMPLEAKSLFRAIGLVSPDFCQIMKVKCCSLGFKAPAILAQRLKIFTDIVKDQMPEQLHHHFSIAAMEGVLKRTLQKRKNIREDKSEKVEKKEDSRSESQASEAPTKFSLAPAQPSSPVPKTRRKRLKRGKSQISQHKVAGTTTTQRKVGTPNPLTAAAKMEHALVAQAVEETIGCRIPPESMMLFRTILKDCFAGLPEPPNVPSLVSAKSRLVDIEGEIERKALDSGLVAHKPWLSKCVQLYNLSQAFNGIVVAGPPGSGKSTCIQAVVEALCQVPRGMSRPSTTTKVTIAGDDVHKLLRINPLVVDDLGLMFGSLNQNHDWVDGIFTSAVRKANRNISTTWLCLDGPLHKGWADNFNSFLSGDKTIHLKNGDKLFLSGNIIVLFETDSLEHASPACLARSGVLYLDKDVIGWRPIAKAWLEGRTQLEVHVLQRAFQKTLDPIIEYVMNEAKPTLRLSEVGMFKTCLGLLSAMLADNIEIGGEMHIERLYLFCLIWTFGGLLDQHDRKGFSDVLKTLSTALPDDDRDICVFDYYVDESGEWDPWHSRVPEAVYADNQDMLGEVFVDTVDTIRTRILMEFAAASGKNVLLVGPHGSGKTTLINDFIDAQDPQQTVCKRLVFSGASTASQLQQFIESNIYHRQGFVYGARDNKKLRVFIDDLNLPVPDVHGVQKCNELLRQLLDERQLCTLQKPFEWHTVEGLTIFSALAISEYAAVSNRFLSDRLLRHFAVFALPVPKEETLKSVVHGILECNMTDQDTPGLDLDLHNNIVAASCELLADVQSVLRPSPMPGRHHYLFTLKDLTKCFQCMKRLADESKADEAMVISLWRHEMQRIIRDRICRMSDLYWLDDTLDRIILEQWPKMEGQLHDTFVTFPTDTRLYNRPVTSLGAKQIKVVLQPVENLGDLHSCLNAHLTRYNEEFGNVHLDVMLSDYTIGHIVRIHRILSFHHGGNLLLIGAVGSHLSTLCRLALHVADIPIHKVDTSKQNNFFDGLRSAIRLSGAEGKIISLMFTGRDLEDPVYLDAINSLLISGEYPHLFSNDEMEGLLQAIHPAMKREFPNLSVDPTKFFVSRVKCNLHIIVCLSPRHQLIKNGLLQYPGLLSGCQIAWLCDWPQEALLGEASYFIARHQLTQEFEDLSENVTTCLANIHSYVLRDCKQMPWAGDPSPYVVIQQAQQQQQQQQGGKDAKDKDLKDVKEKDKKKEEKDGKKDKEKIKVRNLPYAKNIILERIRLNHRDHASPGKNEVYVGPTTYRRFMDSFKYLYSHKSKHRTEKVDQLKKALATLDQTRLDAKVMRKAIKTTTERYEGAKKTTAALLQQLILKATVLEKLKAKVGLSSSLDAYLHLTELEADSEEEDELLKDEEYDDYDAEFDRMREATLKTRQVQAKEELVQAQVTLQECRDKLDHARQQVIFWRTKVDRSCIERLRGFANPPVLVGQVMEMVMTLIGKRLPSMRLTSDASLPTRDDMSHMSSRMSTSSGSSKLMKKPKAKEAQDKFDKAQWKSMALTMTDSLKFVDMLHNVSWEDGLPNDVLSAVESYLATSKDGQLGVTGEGSLLENAQEKNFVASKRTLSPDRQQGITIANAKYSSEDCATLVQYTIAIVEYTRLCGPLRAAQERLNELQREIEENERLQRQQEEEPQEEEKPEEPEEEEDLTEADLPHIQELVNELQLKFDQAVVQKHSLNMELHSMNERLKAASEVVESLKAQEGIWRQYVKDNDGNELLLANCIAASAFLTYSGPVNVDTRQRMGEFYMQVCRHHGLPLHKDVLFRDTELFDFLHTEIDKARLHSMRLPTARLMLENASFLLQEASTTAWPLVCDPTSRAISWFQDYFKDKNFVEVRYHEMRSQLENCLSDGTPLLVTDCDVIQLCQDDRFLDTLANCLNFVNGKNRFKVIVEDHEVECDPRFRLYLHTTVEPHAVPIHLAAATAVTFFQLDRTSVTEELLDCFMEQEKARLENEKKALQQEKLDNMVLLDSLEQQMVELLSSDVRLMNDLQSTKRLAEFKKQFDETKESQCRVETMEDSIMKARDGFRLIATRGAVCLDTAQYLRELNPLYQVSFRQFMELFQAAISHSERSSVKAVIEKLTMSAFTTSARGLLERDRQIFSLLLAIEVEESNKNIEVGEREFVISPNYGSVVMISADRPANANFSSVKKPFDWMLDDQYHNLQVLASHFEWFQDMFDRMPRDGRETQWRMLCESDQPEHAPLPDKMDESFRPMQRLCIVRAVRNDRLIQASTVFVNSVLGKKYTSDVGLDLPTVLRQSCPSTPIMLLFSNEAQLAVHHFNDFACKKQQRSHILNLTDNSSTTMRAVRKQLQQSMSDGSWLLLHCAHNTPSLLPALEALLEEAGSPDSQFRVWVSIRACPKAIPVRLLQNSVRVVVDVPRVMKDGMVRSFTAMEPDILKQCARSEWPAMLHNLCYLHAALQLRCRYGHGGWNSPHDFGRIGFTELQEAIAFAMSEFKDPLFAAGPDGTPLPRTTSWTGIRYMLSEVVYGSYVTDNYDQLSLSAMVDYWMSPNALKKDFEVARLKYRLPQAFFNPSVRLTSLIQALDGLACHFLDVPEGCHLHPNVETLLGEDQYVFTRLNKIFDAMPATDTLTHKLFPRPPTPYTGPPLAGVSSSSNNPYVVDQGEYASASYTMFKLKKEADLHETCLSILQKIPRAYNKDHIVERVKKIGGFTVFNNLLIKEMDTMSKLLTEIKSTVNTIKMASETGVLGDQVSEYLLGIADDLYYSRIPQAWCLLASSSAPPPTWGVAQFLNELALRCQHFEKILSLGRERMPCYWLGAFFNPRALLAILKQEAMRNLAGDRSGNFDNFVFQTEVTSRDKDHLRDPPQEGMFIHGIHVWGCAWEKTTGELQDAPPRTACAALPVVHVTCWPQSDKPSMQDSTRASETYQCPVYHSRQWPRQLVMEMDVRREGIPANRWALRGLSATIRPF